MKKSSVEKLNIFLAFFSYICLIVLTVILKNILFPRLSVLGGNASLCLIVISSMAIYSSFETSALFALLMGISFDAINSIGISLTPLLFIAFSLFYSSVGKKAKQDRIFVSWLCFLPCLPIADIIIGLVSSLLAFGKTIDIILLFKTELLPNALNTLIFALPFFFITKLFDIPATSVRRKGGD